MSAVFSTLKRDELALWRLDQEVYKATWDSGEGAFQTGGRWNSRGTRCVYCSLDASTAILEVAVHKGFTALNTVPHVVTCAEILDPNDVHVVHACDVPNPSWLIPGSTSFGQQTFGDQLLSTYKFIAIPSTISSSNWNLIFVASKAAGAYQLKSQGRFALDPRLDPSP